MQGSKKRHSFEMVFIIALFCAFVVMSLLLVAFGSRIYKNTVDELQSSYAFRTSLSYIAGKSRYNTANDVSVGNMEDVEILIFSEEAGGMIIDTAIYYHDGYLREIAIQSGTDFNLSSGSEIIELDGIDFEIQNGLLTITVNVSGKDRSVTLFVGSEKEAA